MVTQLDTYLFHQGTHYASYQFMGAHFNAAQNDTTFTVWAPNAQHVYVATDENGWTGENFELTKIPDSGLFTGTFPLSLNTVYKYKIITLSGDTIYKSDPYAFYAERRPNTASIVTDTSYEWTDDAWLRKKSAPYDKPINIYEVHLGTWKKHDVQRHEDESIDSYTDRTHFTYKEMADTLIPYVKEMGYTHIEIMPITEHPFDLSWGYQVTGYYAPTSRFGTPQDFKYFVDMCHSNNIGVILDWVPAHFCKDDHGLRLFDGTPIYEHQDAYRAEKRGWGTLTFDFGRTEVQSFLISNALFWINEYHIDGLRVDAVHSMTDLNFENYDEHERIYNDDGTSVNKEAIAFLQKLNTEVFRNNAHTLMIAEDSSKMKSVTTAVKDGGLGFNFKWDLGFMHDTLNYMALDPIERQHYHKLINFPMMYRYDENFILPFSHDEVVHGKLSMLDKMPGDQWRKFAQYRLLYGYQLTQPGKKLNFMGSEIGMYAEWKDKEQVDWLLLDYPIHHGLQTYVKDLNHLYKKERALFELDYAQSGFKWIDADNNSENVASYIRTDRNGESLIIILNFSPNVYYDFPLAVDQPGKYKEYFNSDHKQYGGSHQIIHKYLFSQQNATNGFEHSIRVKVPPFGFVIYKKVKERKTKKKLQKIYNED
ncbi:1,4-alpha-glucan branching protein GlgB [Macrococcus armenti]|uniref:1,4-alpha-glucan branching protein GlgB n=1 Tax=Macrococcus armenti TaxID=2875764 RepID=UPI001CCCF3D3|nr:1,4-alpha-glucan branching protein GlgB [Macrococcus armenti]UBH16239.1 1,4-alpha-glucan branching protein GlgB [Macrococcus armenti]UBH18598.1 1,4-alpha-glucan branching protein GlgB [Macrococcus armenti]UBH20867.1 1,4-alpha-glucan branching protein GlgB [Macrococcus armenti]